MPSKNKRNAKSKMPVSKARTAYELLQEIRKIILEEPKRYDQHDTLDKGDRHLDMPACGTVGCVAGWVCALKLKRRPNGEDVLMKAESILGLDAFSSYSLFRSSACGCTNAQTIKHARAGAAHINRFMEANKAQLKAKKV